MSSTYNQAGGIVDVYQNESTRVPSMVINDMFQKEEFLSEQKGTDKW